MRTEGIDVSYHNGSVNWEEVKKAGKEFAFVRIGYSGYAGEIHMDEKFYENFDMAEKAGLKVGIYVYAYNNNCLSAKKTAREIKRILGERKPSMPVAFDVEETKIAVFTSKTKRENSLICLSFMEEIKKLGMEGMLYTYTNFAKNYMDMELLKDVGLWIADYRDETGGKCPYDGKFSIWQYKGNTGRCKGVEGPCDLNLCYRDEEGFYREKYENLKDALREILSKA